MTPTQCDLYKKSAEQRFDEYHRENPKVFDMFVRFAQQAADARRKRIGAKMLMERIRWETVVSGAGDEFKINNNYTSRYVRLLGKERPQLAALFATRKLKK